MASNFSMAGPYLGLPIPGLILAFVKVLGSCRPSARTYSSCPVVGFALSSLFCSSKLTLNHLLRIQESFKFSNYLVVSH